jgi:glycosyltransferase involved in cell wall biosynthesis
MSVLGLVPAYQAEASIAGVVRGAGRHLSRVLVVDDGSSDATARAAEDAGAQVLRLERHRGKGGALRAGFQSALDAGHRAVVTLDADGQHDPDEIPLLIERWVTSRAALVIGSRASLEAQMTPMRRFGNRFSRVAVSIFAGVEIPDSQSGFRLYDAALLRALPLTGNGYELESEVIVKAARSGFRIESAPIHLSKIEGTATSHYRPWRDTARICVAVVRGRYWSPGCS